MRDDSAENPVFSAGGPCEQFWHGQGCPLFDVVHPAFPLPTTASPTLQGAPKNSSGQALTVCDTPEPGKFLSPESCQNRFLCTHMEVDLALHPVIGFEPLPEKFSQALGLESLDPFLRSQQAESMFRGRKGA